MHVCNVRGVKKLSYGVASIGKWYIITDYDGDSIGTRGVYTKEANEELSEFINSKANYINLSGRPLRSSSNEAIQSIYDLTRVIPNGAKLDEVVF